MIDANGNNIFFDEEENKMAYDYTCCICHKEVKYNYGYNAEPIMKGICCEECNDKIRRS